LYTSVFEKLYATRKFVCERSFGDPLTYLLRIHVQKCGYQFISAFERRRVLDTPELKKAGIEHSKYLVATTDQDNANMLVCQIAKTNFGFTEEKLVARVNKTENLQAFRDLGIRSISPTIATAVMLDGIVGHPVLFSVCEVSGEGDIVEVRACNKKIFGKAIKEIHLPEDSLIVMIRRKNDSIIAHPETILQDGDYVTIMGKLGAVKDAANMMK
jgi:Trk K+ transport system NAD-binding subunit